MAHLPNEIWLHIISHCNDNASLWNALRHVNAQLRACVEQHFEEEILPHLTIALPMTLPTYDARNPIRGEAIFKLYGKQYPGDKSYSQHGHVIFKLRDAGPEFYLSHFLGRWAGMKDVEGGWIRESVRWNVSLFDRIESRKIKAARAVTNGVGDDEARIEFDWKTTLTGFYLI